MSGLAFQKLNGAGTIATAQLDKLAEINANITDVKNKLVSPDLRAWFKILFPGIPVIPFYKTFSFSDPVDASVSVSIGKKLFANVYMSVAMRSVSSTNNTYVGARLHAMYDAVSVFEVSAKVHGNDIIALPAQAEMFTGVLNGLFLQKFGSSQSLADGKVVIVGFVLPDAFDVATLTALQPVPDSVGADTQIQIVQMPSTRRLTIVDIPDGINYDALDMLNFPVYEIYYIEGGNFLTPGVDFVNKPAGGFTLTGFAPLVLGQMLLVIF